MNTNFQMNIEEEMVVPAVSDEELEVAGLRADPPSVTRFRLQTGRCM